MSWLNPFNAVHTVGSFVKTTFTSHPILSSISTIVAIAISSLSLYQYISTKLDEKRYLPPGEMVDVGGYKLHIHCIGKGVPTVVLESGLGVNSLGWCLVQPEIAKFAKVCSYDRAGYGWSEKSPHPRTSEQMVLELHTLLQKAKIPPPYILVGHSLGGMNVQLYASRYRNEVCGLILVDSCHEKILEAFSRIPKWKFWIANCNPLPILFTRLGIQRLLLHSSNIKNAFPMLSNRTGNRILAHMSTSKQIQSVVQESSHLEESLLQLKKAHFSFRNLPLKVISAGKTTGTEEVNMRTCQEDLATRSSQGKLLIAENSDHMIPFNQPEIIVEAVKEVIGNTTCAEYSSKPSENPEKQ
ncbi:MAG: alpha/beta hydrolase [Chlamydiota bacterium]